MEKLIELLDEYRKQNPREFFGDEGSLVVLTGKDFIELNRLIIISKEYGFIKYLVDNDKIERKKVGIYAYNYAIAKVDFNHIGYKEPQILHRYVKDEGILMLLSISDTPIEDLISYLK